MSAVTILWRNMSTGATGHGEPLPHALAEAWLSDLQQTGDGIEYRLEAEGDAPEKPTLWAADARTGEVVVLTRSAEQLRDWGYLSIGFRDRQRAEWYADNWHVCPRCHCGRESFLANFCPRCNTLLEFREVRDDAG